MPEDDINPYFVKDFFELKMSFCYQLLPLLKILNKSNGERHHASMGLMKVWIAKSAVHVSPQGTWENEIFKIYQYISQY